MRSTGVPPSLQDPENIMSHPIDLAFPGEPEFRDSPLLDAIQQGWSLMH